MRDGLKAKFLFNILYKSLLIESLLLYLLFSIAHSHTLLEVCDLYNFYPFGCWISNQFSKGSSWKKNRQIQDSRMKHSTLWRKFLFLWFKFFLSFRKNIFAKVIVMRKKLNEIIFIQKRSENTSSMFFNKIDRYCHLLLKNFCSFMCYVLNGNYCC